jgi:hypothetical protein
LIIAITCIVAIAVIAFILSVRPNDLPAPEPESPFRHLDERKAAIYENLRDLQFEYRVGKLSDADYQATKKDLQKELAAVLAEADKLVQGPGAGAQGPGSGDHGSGVGNNGSGGGGIVATAVAREPEGFVCPACGAKFERELKFCGECGKAMGVAR